MLYNIRPNPVRVRLEQGDLEVAAMQSCHPISAPNESISGSSGGTKVWQSWAVRRVISNMI